MSYFPYLEAIKSIIQMAFPDKMVSVRCEDTLLYPREILIKATVNDYETYVCSNAEFNEKAIADLLLPKIQEKNGRNQ